MSNNKNVRTSGTTKENFLDENIKAKRIKSLETLFSIKSFTERFYSFIGSKCEKRSYHHLGVTKEDLPFYIAGQVIDDLHEQADKGKGPLLAPKPEDPTWQNWVFGFAKISIKRFLEGKKAERLRQNRNLTANIEDPLFLNMTSSFYEEYIKGEGEIAERAVDAIEKFVEEFGNNSIEKEIIKQKLHGKAPREIAEDLRFDAKKVSEHINNATKRYRREYKEMGKDPYPLHIRQKFIKESRQANRRTFTQRTEIIEDEYGTMYQWEHPAYWCSGQRKRV